MNGAEKIRDRIISDARERAAKIVEAARLEGQGLIKDAEKQAFQNVVVITEKAKQDAALYKQRFHAAGGMEDKKSILKTRQDTIDEAFSTALLKISDLPEEKYSLFIEDILLKVVKEDEGELFLNKRDKQRLGQGFIERANAKIKALGKTAKLTLAADDLNSCGGFVVRYGEMEINCTLEVILNMARPNLEAEVAGILFSE